MNQDIWYSVRMRASQLPDQSNEKHISGGELLSRYDQLEQSIALLSAKALHHSRGQADYMQIQCEKLTMPIINCVPLSPSTFNANTVEEGLSIAKKLLIQTGVTPIAIERDLSQLFAIGQMRGAMIVDCISGQRMDADSPKGVRVTRLHWDTEDFQTWCQRQSIPENNRTKEALTLASKVAHHPSSVAELCWSDDPEYITGYVASDEFGYQRITYLKNKGDEQGCRIFFVKPAIEIQAYTEYLTTQPIKIQSKKEC